MKRKHLEDRCLKNLYLYMQLCITIILTSFGLQPNLKNNSLNSGVSSEVLRFF